MLHKFVVKQIHDHFFYLNYDIFGKKIMSYERPDLYLSFDTFLVKLHLLEVRQYKNDSIQSKKKSNFEVAALFHHLYGKGKRAATSKLEFFYD